MTDPQVASDETTATAPETPAATSAPTSAETQNTDERAPIPYARFKEVNDARKALEDQIAKLNAERESAAKAEEKRKRDEQAAQGKFKDLYDQAQAELDTLKAQAAEAAEFRKIFDAQLKRRLEGVPEPTRKLLAEMTPLKAMAWLDEHADQIATQRKAPPTDAGKTGDRPGTGNYVGSEEHLQAVRAKYSRR